MQILLSGPQGIGKSAAAEQIADALGLNRIIDNFEYLSIPDGCLAITNDDPPIEDVSDDVVVIKVASASALNSLVMALESQAQTPDCQECTYMVNEKGAYRQCRHPEYELLAFCENARHISGRCGPDAKLFLFADASQRVSQFGRRLDKVINESIGADIATGSRHECCDQLGMILGVAISKALIDFSNRHGKKCCCGLSGLSSDATIN